MTLPYVCMCAGCAAAHSISSSTGSALPPAPPAPVIANAFTGDYRIDALLEDPQYRWNQGAAAGTPVTVSYSFMSDKPLYGGTDSGTDTGFSTFTQAQRDATRAVFTKLEQQLSIRFTEVSDSAGAYGQIRMGNNTQGASAGYAYLPFSTGDDKSGDIWLDQSVPSNLTNLALGTAAYATLVHEIGHALGLKHPGNYNAGETSSATAKGNFLGALEDNTAFSIMSYRDAPGALQRDWFGEYDLLALRTLYGSGTATNGANTYTLTDATGSSMTTLYDSGGTDTLSLSVSTTARVDLRSGGFSSVGTNSNGAAVNNLSIDLSTVIENFVGGAEDDIVIGNAAANLFTLGAGTNTADGGAGIDTAAYVSARAAYQVTVSGNTLRVAGTGTGDTLTNVERLVFSDRKFAFDANATTTAKILGSVFGKEAVANKAYAGIGLSLLDGGTNYADLMQMALGARLGPGASNDAVVTLLYTNLVGNAPGAAELGSYSGLISSGQLTQAGLGVVAAEHALNAANINLVGLAQTGLEFA